MRRSWRPALAAPGLACIMLAACAGQTTGVGLGPTVVRGDAVVAPDLLTGNQRVVITREASAVSASPNPAWSILAGTLDLRFAHPLQVASSMTTGLHLTLSYPADRAAEVLNAKMPLVVVTYADHRSARFGFVGSFDTAHDRVSVDVPKAALRGAVDVKLGLAVDNPFYTLPPPGPRYWTGTQWSRTGTIDPKKRTLVFIHGVFSSVETAFPDPCTPEILKAGGYQQGLGWDYNWTDPPQVEGPKFAGFLNGLGRENLTSFDIEAHSYGSVITYAAIPSVTEKLSNVVTLGGPLPLRGSPLARGYLLRLVLTTLADIFVGPPSLIDHAYRSGMVKSLATNGSEMRTILAGIRSMKNKPDFIDVAGTEEYPEEFALYPFLYFYIDYPWDGIVEKIAANSKNVLNSFPNSFYKEHTELECAGEVIAYVGSQVHSKAENARPSRR